MVLQLLRRGVANMNETNFEYAEFEKENTVEKSVEKSNKIIDASDAFLVFGMNDGKGAVCMGGDWSIMRIANAYDHIKNALLSAAKRIEGYDS